MCSTCQPTTRKEKNKLETRTTTMQKQGVNFAFWRHAQKRCVDATSPSLTKDVIIQPRRGSVRLHQTMGAQKNAAKNTTNIPAAIEKPRTAQRLEEQSTTIMCDSRAQECPSQLVSPADCGGDMDKPTRMFDISTLSNLARRNPFLGATCAQQHKLQKCSQEPPRNSQASAETTRTQSARREQLITCVTIVLREHT